MPLAEKNFSWLPKLPPPSRPLLSLKKGMNVTIFGHERSPSSPALTALSRGTRAILFPPPIPRSARGGEGEEG